jgi:hypothetical protein
MGKLLKFILIIQLLGWIGSVISGLYTQPLALLIALLINLLIWIGLWKGTNFVVSNPEDGSLNKKANLIRWAISFFFSIFALEVGILVSFIIRFFIDRLFEDRNLVAVVLVNSLSSWFGKTIIMLGILVAFPILYFIGKSLQFKKPIYPAILLSLLWAILILIMGPMISL